MPHPSLQMEPVPPRRRRPRRRIPRCHDCRARLLLPAARPDPGSIALCEACYRARSRLGGRGCDGFPCVTVARGA